MAKQKKGALFGTGSSLVAALTIGAWGAGAVQAAHAQDAEEDIVVTGSSFAARPKMRLSRLTSSPRRTCSSRARRKRWT